MSKRNRKPKARHSQERSDTLPAKPAETTAPPPKKGGAWRLLMPLAALAIGIAVPLWWMGRLNRQQAESQSANTPITPAQPTSERAPELLAQLRSGVRMLQAGSYSAAFETFSEAQRTAPDDPDVLLGLGRSLHELGQDQSAEQILRGCLDQDPDNVEAMISLAVVLSSYGQTEEADAILQRASGLSPGNAGILRLRGHNALLLGKNDQALTFFQQAVRLGPQNALAQAYLGRASMLAGDLAGANRAFQTALQLDANLPRTHYWLAELRRLQGARAEAAKEIDNFRQLQALQDYITQLERSVMRNGEDYDSRILLARALVVRGRAELSLPHLRKAMALKQDDPQAVAQLKKLYDMVLEQTKN